MSTEPRTVPNGSKVTSTSGRPACVTDEELLAIVQSLADREGRIPTLDSIIRAAGRCQRSRAVKARQAYAEQLANDNVQIALKIPEALELQHRKLMAQWHQLAYEQASLSIKDQVRLAEQRAMEAELSALDARARLDNYLQENGELTRRIEVLKSDKEALKDKLAERSNQLTRTQAIAEERACVIKQLTDI